MFRRGFVNRLLLGFSFACFVTQIPPRLETRGSTLETRNSRPDPRHPTPNTQHLSPDTQHPSPNTQHPTPNTRKQRPNLLLITIDTLRADRLGCYGYSRARTPVLDQLAREGVRFERAFS